MVNVGVDVWDFHPISIKQILKELKNLHPKLKIGHS